MRIEREGTSIRRQPVGGEEILPDRRSGEVQGRGLPDERNTREVFGKDRFTSSAEEGEVNRSGTPKRGGAPRRGGEAFSQGRFEGPHAMGRPGMKGDPGAPMPGPMRGAGRPGEVPDAAAERFMQADQDGDGVLSQEEFAAALASPPMPAPPRGGRPPMGPPPSDSGEIGGFRHFSPPTEPQSESGVLLEERSEAADLQAHLLEQMDSLLQDDALSDVDREFIQETAEAIASLDPEDPQFHQDVERLLTAASDMPSRED